MSATFATPRRRSRRSPRSSREARRTRASRSGASRSSDSTSTPSSSRADTASLEKGPGHYPDTAFPGQGTTIGIAGHRTTYRAPFRHIDSLQPGDEIKIEMPYADFVYTVQTHRIVAPTETDIVDPVGYERLVLTACHPLYSASQRYAVFAKLKSEHLRSNSG